MERRNKAQMSKLALSVFLFVALFASVSYAQGQAGQKVDLEKLSQEYFAKNDYDGLYAYLMNALAQKKLGVASIYYYLALTRQKNIDYWSQIKDWEGVYDKAEGFKKSISSHLKQAEATVKNDPALFLKIKYLKWRRAIQDNAENSMGLFNDLVNAASESRGALEVVHGMADELSMLEDKNLSRRLYEVYVKGLIASSASKEALKSNAQKFLADNKIYLAKTLFDAYLAQFSGDKETQAKEIVGIANLFAHQGVAEGPDPVFAEEMYKKAFDLAGIAAFSADSLYRRAFNLERLREYQPAFDSYKSLLEAYPDYSFKAAVDFRMGVISAYALDNFDQGIEFLLKVKEEGAGSLAVSSSYELGLLNQRRGEFEKAAAFYKGCLEAEATQSPDAAKNKIFEMARERLGEIDYEKEMSYNLRMFFDGITKEDMPLNVDLTAVPAVSSIGKPVKLVVVTSAPQTGCMTPSYSYEWSGETGSIANIPNSPELTTDYPYSGIKVVHVAVIGPGGLEGAGFEMAEIQETK